ncbi:hypothetical protein ABZ621_33915 [Streptomyces sp. NPDC007863]|uniref:hypothetical protein n=1 Tax=Streptomyces sp. NPDC007863 TaxID=3154894 RepID=UPI0033F86C7F
MPPRALAGAGRFATTLLDATVWPELTRRSTEHTPTTPWEDEPARRHARTLLTAATALPDNVRREETGRLRRL